MHNASMFVSHCVFDAVTAASLIHATASVVMEAENLFSVGGSSARFPSVYVKLVDTVWGGWNSTWTSLDCNSSLNACKAIEALGSSTLLLERAVISGMQWNGEGGAVSLTQRSSMGLWSSELSHNSATVTCDATSGGGALSLASGTTAMIQNSSLHHNSLPSDTCGCGGGVSCVNCTLTFLESKVEFNSAVNGGGICVSGGAALQLKNETRISSNTARGSGGGIFVAGAAVHLANGSSLCNNTATQDGGAVHAHPWGGQACTIEVGAAVTLENNTAQHGGGGAFYLELVSLAGVVQSLEELRSVVSPFNAAVYGARVTDGPRQLVLQTNATDNNYYLRESLGEFNLSLCDSLLQVVNAPRDALRPMVRAAVVNGTADDKPVGSLVGTLQQQLQGTAVFNNLEYGGAIISPLSLSFVASVPWFNGTSQEVAAVAVFNVSGCRLGYSFLNSTGLCQQCFSGSYANTSNPSACALCSAGMAASTSGLQHCTPCAKGFAAGAQGSSACTQCLPGRYTAAQGSVDCDLCEVGRYSDTHNATECIVCTKGSTAASPGATVCATCPAGSFANETGMSACFKCGRGRYQAAENSTECEACPLGSVSANSGATTCDVCQSGSFANDTGLERCIQCDAGYYQSSTNASACLACKVGAAAVNPNAVACNLCPVGAFTNATAAEKCLSCSPGYFQDSTNQSSCHTCPVGRVSANPGSSTCDACLAGRVAGAEGLSACSPCQPGFYANASELSECTPCPAGYYAENLGTQRCVECSAGKRSSSGIQSGAVDCLTCVAGTYAPAGSYNCLNCSAGHSTFNSAGLGECLACVAGRYTKTDGVADCTQCPSGRYNNATNQSVCYLCTRGSSSSAGATVCTLCSGGSFRNITSGLCQPCARGSFTNVAGHTHCELCPTGRAAVLLGSVGCQLCVPGRVASADGRSSCSNCALGSFVNESGASECLPCAPGRIAPGSGASACNPCSKGTFVGQDSMSSCLSCPPGRFGNTSGLTYCHACRPGRYAPSEGARGCEPAVPGSAVPTAAAVNQTQCPVGTYAADRESLLCSHCVGTNVSLRAGATQCSVCPAGKFRLSASECADCKPGSFSQGNLSRSCTPCEPGTYMNITGAQRCIECSRGDASAARGARVCTACTPGRYASRLGQQLCDICRQPQFSDRPRAVSCTLCTNDQHAAFYPDRRFHRCEPCPAGVVCVAGVIHASDSQYVVTDDATGSATVLSCFDGGCVSGGNCSADRKQPAAANPLCGQCAEGLFQWGTECRTCEGVHAGFLALFVLLCLAFTYWQLRAAQRTTATISVFVYFAQTTYLMVNTTVWSQWPSVLNMEPAEATGSSVCIAPIPQIGRAFLGLAFPVASFVALLLFALIRFLSFRRSSADGVAPRTARMSLSAARHSNESSSGPSSLPVDALMPWQEMDELGVPTGQRARSTHPHAWHLCVYMRAAISIYLFTYNSVTAAALRFLHCVSVSGYSSYVVAYPAIDCNSQEYVRARWPMLIVLVIYGAVIPLGLATKLWWRLRSAQDDVDAWRSFNVRRYYGVLHEAYQKRHWYWRFVMLMRRSALVASSVFLATSPVQKWAVLSVFNVIFLLLHTSVKPYGNAADNHMETLSLTALCLISVAMSTVGGAAVLPPVHSGLLVSLVLIVFVIIVRNVIRQKVLPKVQRGIQWCRGESESNRASSLPSPTVELTSITRSADSRTTTSGPLMSQGVDASSSVENALFAPGSDTPLPSQVEYAAAFSDHELDDSSSVARRPSVTGDLPDGWAVHLTDDLVPYYTHPEMGSQWVKPDLDE